MSDKIPWAMALSDFFGGSGEAAAVNPADLKNVWTMMRDAQARAMAGQLTSIDSRAYENVCSTDADVVAVWYRVSMLELLQMVPAKPLTPWSHGGEFDDAVFQVAATFPMKKLPVGIEQNGLPFDVQEFVKQIGALA